MAIPFASPTDSSILSIVQEAAEALGQTAPSTLNSTTKDTKRWVKAANFVGNDIHGRFLWPNLRKRFLITTQAGVLTYNLPVDFDRSVFDTFWQKSAYRPMLGPLTPREWEAQKDGIATSSIYTQFQLVGTNSIPVSGQPGTYNVMEIMIDPGAGQEFYFQFQSTNWILPERTWATGESYSVGEYCEYKGNVYKCTSSSAPTGPIAPVHMVGTEYDTNIGGIPSGCGWTYAAYDSVCEDGARPLLDKNALIHGIQMRWCDINGLDSAKFEKLYNDTINGSIGHLAGSRSFSIARETRAGFMTWNSVPQTGWGTP